MKHFITKPKQWYLQAAILWALLRVCVSAQAGEPFRFALLTDIHIDINAPGPTQDLRNSVDQINASDSIDFILVTGDIADKGDGASLRLAKQELDRLQRPYYIVQGNHDQKWSESGCMDFKRIFGYERFKFEHRGYLFLGFPSGPLMRMALGHVAPEDIEWLKEELRHNGFDKPVFLVSHMPMLPEDVDNCFDVTDAVRPYPVQAFLCGHYHRNLFTTYDGLPGFVNITNLRQKGHTAGQYNEYDVTADSIIAYTHPFGLPRHRWAAVALGQSHGPGAAATSPLRPDFSVNRDYPMVKAAWQVALRAGIYSSPAIDRRRIVVADNLGRVTSFDHQGRRQWQYTTGARIIGTPAIGRGVVVAGSADGFIYGIDAHKGTLRWKVRTQRPVVSAVTIRGGIAYVGSGDHIFRAIRVKDGTIRWSQQGIRGYVETRPLVNRRMVVFGDWANTLYALRRKDGIPLWQWTTGRQDMHYSPSGVWPVTAHGKVFVADPRRVLTAIDAHDGHEVYATKQSVVRESIGISKDRRRVYAKTMRDSVVCYSALDNHPRQLWACNVGFGYEHATVMLPEKDGVVFSSTKNGLIFAIEAKTGRLLWKHKVGNTLVNTVVPLSRDAVLYTDEDGYLGKLSIDKSSLKI